MRVSILVLGFALSCLAQAVPAMVLSKSQITFSSDGFAGPRPDEAFSVGPAPKQLEEMLSETIEKEIGLLPTEFRPRPLTIYLERRAEIKFADDYEEQTPLSVLTSMQNPLEDTIRLGIFEVENDLVALRSILAHEMGHMLVEWASRQSGVTPKNQFLFSCWSKGIYEGVADFISAVMTNSTIVGSPTSWFHRDILKFKATTLAEARRDRLSLNLAKKGLADLQLIPKYRAYRDWVHWLENLFQDQNIVDPYAEGVWLAGQLWINTQGGLCADRVISEIIRVAASGKKFEDPRDFLASLHPFFCTSTTGSATGSS